MDFIDTHSHIYLSHFNEDRDEVIKRAAENKIKHIYLPNIDSTSIEAMNSLCNSYPKTCFPMMGLHPTSVDENFEKELEIISDELNKKKYLAIGECGIDLYWDKTFLEQQKIVFKHHIEFAKKYALPIVIHARQSFNEILDIIEADWDNTLTGVFHSFTGNENDLDRINKLGFYIGIGGIVTFKNSDLQLVIKNIELNKILLESDSPYLAPVPKRGQRNESSYIIYTARKLSEIFDITLEQVSDITTQNAFNLFKTGDL